MTSARIKYILVSSVRKDKEQIMYKMTSARIRYLLLGKVQKFLGRKKASKGAGGNL